MNLFAILKLRVWLAILVWLSTSVAMAAGVYRWHDSQGQIHYGDEPPTGSDSQLIELLPAPNIPAASPQTSSPQANMPAKQTDLTVRPVDYDRRRLTDQQCADLLRQLQVLGKEEAVYRDSQGLYHGHKDEYSQGYYGPRYYLGDSERGSVKNELSLRFKSECRDGEEADARYRKLIEQKLRQEHCEALKNQYDELQRPEFRTGPSVLAALREAVEKACRVDPSLERF